MKLLIEVMEKEGLQIDVNNNGDDKSKMNLLYSISNVLTRNKLVTLEGRETGKAIRYVILARDNVTLKKRKEEFDKQCKEDMKLEWSEREYENKEDNLQELFSKLNMAHHYEIYKSKWTPNTSEMKLDKDEIEGASVFFKRLRPYENENGDVLLAKDCCGNTVWVYPSRNYAKGTFSYRVYMKDYEGRLKPSINVKPSSVGIGSPHIVNMMKNCDGYFTTLDCNKATEILWLYDLCRQFKKQRVWEEPDPTEIYESIKEWIINNIGVLKKINGETKIPVYTNYVKDKGRVDAGIWQKDFKWILQHELGMSVTENEWIRDAAREGWIIPQISSTGQKRNAFNTSNYQRELYARENKNERVYLLKFSDDENEDIKTKHGKLAKERMIKGLVESEK